MGFIENMQPSKWEKWIDLAQTLILAIIIPWAVWVTRSIFVTNGSIDSIHQWQDSRPKFVTTVESELAITRAQEVLRKERDMMFKEIQCDLKELLKNHQEIRIELLKHTEKSNGNGNTP